MTNRSRYSRTALAALALAATLFVGCSPKKAATSRDTTVGPAKDGEAATVAALDGHPDLETIKTALQRLDGLDSVGLRGAWLDADRDEITKLCRLTDAESADLTQRTFTPADYAYLEECLTIRSGLRSLNLDGRQPLDRGTLAFEWVCRTASIDPRVPTPAPAWFTLEGGCGVALSRAYAVLAAWRQAGLDGCLIGPPSLKETPAMNVTSPRPDVPPVFAPVRACGVKVGADVFLFDAAAGKPIPAADGKGVLTLAAARANPAAVKDLAAEGEVKTWQAFVAPPLGALAKRMDWLEKLNPGNVGVKLYSDPREEAARFQDAGGAAVWNAPGDRFSPGRIGAAYVVEDSNDAGPLKSMRERHRMQVIPFELMPAGKDDRVRGFALDAFKQTYDRLQFSPGSPRDLFVRGSLSDALSPLTEMTAEIRAVKDRVAQDRTLGTDFSEYFDKLFKLSADLQQARGNADEYAAAGQRIAAFRSQPKNVDIERTYTLGAAARPMSAEVLFLTAACVHERAERAHLDGSADAAGGWKNAAECWDRFLSEASAVRKAFPGREPHARALKARCQSFLPK